MQKSFAHKQARPQTAAAIGMLALAFGLVGGLPPALGQSLPGAPSIKQGVIKRDNTGEIILDGQDRDVLAELTKGHREKGVGTGFFVSQRGHILTNQHVVEGCRLITAQDVEGQAVKAEIIKANGPLDLAILDSDATPPITATFPAKAIQLRPEARLKTHGYPTLTLAPLQPEETQLRLMEQKPGVNRMVLRGELFPGNSGGPILDMDGRVVGVAVAKVNTVALYRKTGLLIEDISYAVSGSAAFDFLARNGVNPQTTTGSAQQPGDDHRMVVRIGCWS